MRRNRRDSNETSLSFLDVICCGFGAIILLLMITKISNPQLIEEAPQQLEGSIAELQATLFRIRGDSTVLNRELNAKREQLDIERERVARLQASLNQLRAEFAALQRQQVNQGAAQGQLALARQTLTEEMRRLLANRENMKNDIIGGIPVDSEYIIFVIDTSGSMFQNAWPLMMRKLEETLSIYPTVKGIQVMNDEGGFMFPQFSNRWIEDTAQRRRAIMDRIRNWNPVSDSSPVEGIEKAISTFYAPDKRISIYVFGDDFTGPSITNVLETVDHLNSRDASGTRRVRIHAVGFPVNFQSFGSRGTAMRFANLMRQLTFRNQGTFVGLPTYE